MRCAVAAVALCAAVGCSRSKKPDDAGHAAAQPLKVGFQLDWYPAPEHGGHYQALVKNYYGGSGLDVSILAGGPGAYPLPAVGTGHVEFAMGRCDDVILAVRQGLPLLIVCAQMQHDPLAIMVHDDGSVKTFKDLDGKAVMCGPGANTTVFIERHYGVKMKIIPLDWGLARFMADKEFVQQSFITNEPYFAELHGVKVRCLLIACADYDPYRVIFTSKAFAREHPEAVKAFVAGTIRGYTEFLHGDASEARARIQKENPSQTPGLMDYSIEAMKRYKLVDGDPSKGERIGLITPDRMKAMVKTLVDIGVLDAPMPLENFVSFDFLPEELKGAGR